MSIATKKNGALFVVGIVAGFPAIGWSADYSGGTDYKITLPGARPSFSWQSDELDRGVQPRAEMLFKLSVNPEHETRDGGEQADVEAQKWNGDFSSRIDFLKPGEAKMQDLHKGFSYTAGIGLKQPEAETPDTDAFNGVSHFISSRQLGIHFGRLGTVNYSGVDLSFRQFNSKTSITTNDNDDKDLWSLGVTTGRRFSLTGLETSDPIWTVSLRGQFNLVEKPNDNVAVENQQWYLSPGLHWQRDSFRMSADVLMPFLQSGEYEEETDYRIRAKIQKRF